MCEKLVLWAAAALEKSSNQPILPHAIIVLNAMSVDTETRLWDMEVTTMDIMDELARTIYSNPTFQKFAQFWRERERRIDSAGDLMLSYYSSLKVRRVKSSYLSISVSESTRADE